MSELLEDASTFFNTSRNLNGKRQISLLDIGDYYTINFDSQSDSDNIKDVVVKIYKEIDEIVEFINIDKCVNHLQQNLIQQTLGHIVEKKVYEKKEIIESIEDILKFYNVAKKCNRIEKIISSKDHDLLDDTRQRQTNEKNEGNIINSDYLCFKNKNYNWASVSEKNDECNYIKSCNNCMNLHIDKESNIIYHSKFNISIVYENVIKETISPEQICENFPEFILVKKINSAQKHNDMLNELFHKKTFSDIDSLSKKINNFIDLYDIKHENSSENDIDKLKECFNDNFIISEDQNDKMKASELQQIILFFTKNYVDNIDNFRQKLPSLLIESGLKKKRSKEGQYYLGIKKKPFLKNLSLPFSHYKNQCILPTCSVTV